MLVGGVLPLRSRQQRGFLPVHEEERDSDSDGGELRHDLPHPQF